MKGLPKYLALGAAMIAISACANMENMDGPSEVTTFEIIEQPINCKAVNQAKDNEGNLVGRNVALIVAFKRNGEQIALPCTSQDGNGSRLERLLPLGLVEVNDGTIEWKKFGPKNIENPDPCYRMYSGESRYFCW